MKPDTPHIIGWYSATLGVAAGAVTSIYFGVGPVIICALLFALISYFSLTAVMNTDEENSPYHKISEYAAAAGIVVFLPLILLGDFLTALLIFLGFAQLALNLQTHDYRRFYMGLLVSFIGLCAGATESKSGYYLLFFLAYTIFAGMAMGYAYMVQRQGARTPQWDWADRARISALMIGLAMALYLMLPRLPAGGILAQPGSDHYYHDQKWEAEAKREERENSSDPPDRLDALRVDALRADASREEQGADENGAPAFEGDGPPHGQRKESGFDYKGFEESFDIRHPDASGHRFSNRIVARMRAENAQYLRARIFDRFDGLHWRSSSNHMVKLRVGYNGVDLAPSAPSPSSRLQTYEVFIEHHLGDYIPAAAVPVALKFPASAIGVDIFGQIRSPGPLKAGTAYGVTSQYNLINGRLFAELDHDPLPAYTRLPEETDPRIKALADSVTHGAATQLKGAVALERHLRTQYQYDLNAAFRSQNTTPLSKFLFESKSGHCEYFASALAVMLRTQNIPSRLVTGFSATNRNPLTGYYDIYALDGHAWVEAFVDGRGWVILEPTAYYDGPLPEEDDISAQQINDYVERQIRQRNTLGRDDVSFTALMNALWQVGYVMGTAALAYVRLSIIKGWPWLAAIALVGIGGRAAWRKYRYRWQAYRIHRKVAAYQGNQPDPAIRFYLGAIEDLLRLAGYRHPPGDTIERYLERIETIADAQGRTIQDNAALADAFNRIHYNGEAGAPEVIQRYRQLFRHLYAMRIDVLRDWVGNRLPGGF